MVDPFDIVFPGLSEERSRTVRLALLRIYRGVIPTDPLAGDLVKVLARDLPCDEIDAAWILARLERLGWLENGEPVGGTAGSPLRRAERTIVRALGAEFGFDGAWGQSQVTRDDRFEIVTGPPGGRLHVSVREEAGT